MMRIESCGTCNRELIEMDHRPIMERGKSTGLTVLFLGNIGMES